MAETIETDVLIVGAGMAGLMAAHTLAGRGLNILIVDKGRSVGGRLATRRIGGGLADHGAQFFTVRAPEFKAWVERWMTAGVVYQWAHGFSSGARELHQDGHPRYAVRGGMNALAKYLAGALGKDATIEVDTRLTEVRRTDGGWMADDEKGAHYITRKVILTCPVPQSLALLANARHALTGDEWLALQQIEYASCVAGLFVIEGDVNLPEPGALQRPDQPISWMADNRRKGISPDATVITVHAGPGYSRQMYDLPDTLALGMLQAALQPFLAVGTAVREGQVKRWRYALPTMLHPERCLLAAGGALAFAGDAFGEPRVEGAALSGIAAGRALFSAEM